MKAVLVLDEMPENCLNCQLANDEHAPYPPYYSIYCTALEKRIGESWHDLNGDDLRLDDCPLKEMPDHITFDDMNKNPVLKLNEGYVYGWNQALDVIERTED